MQIRSVSLSAGDCFPESVEFIYILVTSTRILPTQLIAANIVSVLTCFSPGRIPSTAVLLQQSHVAAAPAQPAPVVTWHSTFSEFPPLLFVYRNSYIFTNSRSN